MDPPSVKYVATVDGFNIAYAMTGEGFPLVFMPAPLNHLSLRWQHGPFLRSLTERFTLIHYDSRGQGMSSRGLSKDHCFDDYVLDLEAVVNRSGFEKVVVFGSALLANVAVAYAIKNPQHVAALILNNARLGVDRHFSAQLESIAVTDWALFCQIVARTAPSVGHDPSFAAEFITQSVTQADWLHRVQAFKGSDLASMLARVSCPVLVLAPTDGALRGEEDGQAITALIPGARLVLTREEDYLERAATLIDGFLKEMTDSGTKPPPDHLAVVLSEREIEVLRLIASGRSNQQIADELVLSVNTVARHVANILGKADVANRTEAAAFARARGLI